DIDGVAVTRRLRAMTPNSAQHIIAMTAATDPAELEAAMQAGMAGYITKPFHIKQVEELLQQVEVERVK
ncbi:MAG: response regulator, partial [Caldilineaceae bacterium]|nr:response regulator [Caldilineaceae bacterium]